MFSLQLIILMKPWNYWGFFYYQEKSLFVDAVLYLKNPFIYFFDSILELDILQTVFHMLQVRFFDLSKNIQALVRFVNTILCYIGLWTTALIEKAFVSSTQHSRLNQFIKQCQVCKNVFNIKTKNICVFYIFSKSHFFFGD